MTDLLSTALRNEAECLSALTVALKKTAEPAHEFLKSHGGEVVDPADFQHDLTTESISASLLHTGTSVLQFIYLGELENLKGFSQDEVQRAFKPKISFELFWLANDLDVIASLQRMRLWGAANNLPPETLSAEFLTCLERVMVRSYALSLAVSHTLHIMDTDILARTNREEPGAQQEFIALNEDYILEVRDKMVSLASVIDKERFPAQFDVAKKTLINLPAVLSFDIYPGQKAINGIYFPREHQEYVVQQMADQEAAKVKIGPKR